MSGNPKLYAPRLFLDIARKQIGKERVSNLTAFVAKTIDAAFRDSRGTDSQWRTFNVWDTCSRVVTWVNSRIYYGKPVCDEKTLLEQSALYSMTTYRLSQVLATIPLPLRPVFGRLLGLAIKRPFTICTKIMLPLVEQRLKLRSISKDNDLLPVRNISSNRQRCDISTRDIFN